MSCRTLHLPLATALFGLLLAAPQAISQETHRESELTWVRTNVPDGETCFALTFDPANPQRALLGTRPGSLWESLDGGMTWVQKKTVIESTKEHGANAGSISFHPAVPGLWYFGHEKHGAFRSNDNGETWTLINQGLEHYSERHGICFAFDAKDKGTIYYGADGGLFKSTDFGDHWTKCTVGLPTGLTKGKRGNVTVSRLVVHPQTNAVYAGIYACGYGEIPGIYRSLDQGKTWECINHNFDGSVHQEATAELIKNVVNNLKDKASPEAKAQLEAVKQGKKLEGGMMKGWTFDVRMSDTNPAVIAAATFTSLIRSTNAGESWDLMPVVINPRAVAIHPKDPDIMVASGTWEVWVTRDGGKTWVEVSRNLGNPPPNQPSERPNPIFLTFDPAGERIFSLSEAGVWMANLNDLQ